MKITRPKSFFGWTSITVSSIPWAVGLLRFVPRLSRLDLTFNEVTVFLAAGIVLAFIAAARGSGRWAFVALFDLAAFFLLGFLLNLQEPR
jgi:uncharacterized membrane protein